MKHWIEDKEPEAAARDSEVRLRKAIRRHRRERSGVLLALTDGDHPTMALQYCRFLAQFLEGELHVLQILSPESHSMPSVPDAELVQATRRVARCFAEARESKAWCDDVLGQPLLAGRLRIQIGHFIAEAACRAAEVDAAIIVLVPSIGRIGDTAAALADASACPVLVVRTHQYLKPR